MFVASSFQSPDFGLGGILCRNIPEESSHECNCGRTTSSHSCIDAVVKVAASTPMEYSLSWGVLIGRAAPESSVTGHRLLLRFSLALFESTTLIYDLLISGKVLELFFNSPLSCPCHIHPASIRFYSSKKRNTSHCPLMSSIGSISLPKFDPSTLKFIPALEPPPGVTPNFTNPENRNALVIVVGSILMGIMILFYAIRVYTKHFIARKYSWDDREPWNIQELHEYWQFWWFSDVRYISC